MALNEKDANTLLKYSRQRECFVQALCLLKAVLRATCITGHGSLGTPSLGYFVHFSAPGETEGLWVCMGEKKWTVSMHAV